MKRTILSLVSIALICAMTLVSCDELVSTIDNPVGSYVQFAKSELTLEPGVVVLNAATTISTEKITYMSSNEKVATVDQNGYIKAVADGEATITASVKATEYYQAGSATCLVKVDGPSLTTPLTLKVLSENGTICIENPRVNMKYSLNGAKKITIETTDDVTINVKKGDKVAFYGNGTSIICYYGTQISSGTADVKVYGNIMSLVDETGFPEAKVLTGSNAFRELFGYYFHLKDASGLLLPAEILSERCYYSLFESCTNLITPPQKLPAETLTELCYYRMFYNCGSLTAAPELPAKTLANSCYKSMFQKCKSLTTAPELKAQTLVESCYYCMFQYCSKLSYVTCLATDIIAKNCTNYWLNEVAEEGVFTKAKNIDWSNKVERKSGIPSGWQVVEK